MPGVLFDYHSSRYNEVVVNNCVIQYDDDSKNVNPSNIPQLSQDPPNFANFPNLPYDKDDMIIEPLLSEFYSVEVGRNFTSKLKQVTHLFKNPENFGFYQYC